MSSLKLRKKENSVGGNATTPPFARLRAISVFPDLLSPPIAIIFCGILASWLVVSTFKGFHFDVDNNILRHCEIGNVCFSCVNSRMK